MSGLAAAWSDFKETFYPTVAYAEEKEEDTEEAPESDSAEEESKDEESEDEESGDAEDEDEDDDDEDDDEDEDEIKDPLDTLREKYSETVCHSFKHHFDECVERVTHAQEQPGYEDLEEKEDCVEEFFHLQHCLNDHIAPVLFNKLKWTELLI